MLLILSFIFNFIFLILFIVSQFDKSQKHKKEKELINEVLIQKKSIIQLNKECDEFIKSSCELMKNILKDHQSTVKFTKILRVTAREESHRYDAIKMLYENGYIKKASIEGSNIIADIEK